MDKELRNKLKEKYDALSEVEQDVPGYARMIPIIVSLEDFFDGNECTTLTRRIQGLFRIVGLDAGEKSRRSTHSTEMKISVSSLLSSSFQCPYISMFGQLGVSPNSLSLASIWL
jgi:hypothetical protein